MNRIWNIFFIQGVFVTFFLSSISVNAEIKAGVVLPLSGEVAFAGRYIQAGFRLAQQQEGVTDISLIFEDDKSLERHATINAAKKLVHSDQVDIVFHAVVNALTPAAPIYNRAQVPAIVLWDSNKTINALGSYVHGFGYSTEAAGEDCAKFVHETLKAKKIGLISAASEWSQTISDSFLAYLSKKSDVEVQTFRGYANSSEDFRSALLALRDNTVIFAPLLPASTVAVIKQSRSLGYKGKIIAGDAFGEYEIEALGRLAEGIYSPQIWLENTPLRNAYSRQFSSQPSAPELAMVAMGYDAYLFLKVLSGVASGQGGSALNQAILQQRVSGYLGELNPKELKAGKLRREVITVVSDGVLKRVEGRGVIEKDNPLIAAKKPAEMKMKPSESLN